MQLVVIIKVEEGTHPQAVPDEADIEEKERENGLRRILTLNRISRKRRRKIADAPDHSGFSSPEGYHA